MVFLFTSGKGLCADGVTLQGYESRTTLKNWTGEYRRVAVESVAGLKNGACDPGPELQASLGAWLVGAGTMV